MFHFKMLGGSGVQLGAYSLHAQSVKWDNMEENNAVKKKGVKEYQLKSNLS